MVELFLSPKVQQLMRFLINGSLNTLFSYGIYLALSTTLSYQWAYFIAYFFGIIMAYWLNSTLVFRVPLSWKRLFTYPIIYIIQYIFSAALLVSCVEFTGVSTTCAPLCVTVVMLPMTFLMNKFVLEKNLNRL